jgi:hypothetical protein
MYANKNWAVNRSERWKTESAEMRFSRLRHQETSGDIRRHQETSRDIRRHQEISSRTRQRFDMCVKNEELLT